MRWIAAIVGCALGGAVLAGTAEAATLKVGQGKAYATIGEAVTAASDGDKILVFKGRYTESVVVAGRADLTFRAKKGVDWLPEAWGGACLDLSQGADGARVQGFRFRTTGTAIVLGAVNGVRVEKCAFRGAEYAVDGVGDDFTMKKCDVRRGGNGLRIEGARFALEASAFVAIARDGIDVTGDDARLIGNTVRIVMDSSNIRVIGHRARLERNRVRVSTRHGIEVIGDDATVARNDISQPADDGVNVLGANARVERNRVSSSGDDGIQVVGGAFTVARNRVFDTNDATASIHVDNAGEPGVATLSDNVVLENAQTGFEIRGVGVRSSGNEARDCGSRGFEIRGADHVLTGDTVIGANRTAGFDVFAPGTRLVKCSAAECVQDGFRIEASDVTLEKCRATECDAEGLHNLAVGTTTFSGCTFVGNRQDVAATPGGTLVDGGGNRFETGGVDAIPVD